MLLFFEYWCEFKVIVLILILLGNSNGLWKQSEKGILKLLADTRIRSFFHCWYWLMNGSEDGSSQDNVAKARKIKHLKNHNKKFKLANALASLITIVVICRWYHWESEKLNDLIKSTGLRSETGSRVRTLDTQWSVFPTTTSRWQVHWTLSWSN